MASPDRPASPSQISTSLIQSLKQEQKTLATCKEDLGQLDIPKLKEGLAKFGKLLDFSKKSRGNEDAISHLVGLASRLNQTTLAPVSEAKRSSSFSVSEDLRRNLCTLFNELDTAIPDKTQSSRFRLGFNNVDTANVVVDANVKIESALNTFLQQGTIEKTNGYHLVQTKRDPTVNLTNVYPSNQPQGTIQPQAGSSNTKQAEKLPSQVQRALDKCPRFRILLLGKSGAGKSSLINKVFGVSSAEIAHYQAGRAKIDQEHTSELNPYFVLHDSMGFESGSQEQYKIVEDFIQERNSKSGLTDKLHAIWLCTAIPVSGGRVFETGDEQIFSLKLGNVPLIVVFTQYDNLVTKVEMEGNVLDPEFESKAKATALDHFSELCARPLENICIENLKRDPPPYTKVSVQKSYEDTLLGLIRLTRDLLPPDARDQVPPDMGYHSTQGPSNQTPAPDADSPRPQDQSTIGITWAIAQRVDPITKIEAIIAIGRQRYWRGLASSFDFSGKTLESCIDVVHDDIVQVWNFLDPDMYLMSHAFKTLMYQIVDDLVDHTKGSSTAKLAAALSGAAGLTGILAAVAPPSALVVGPLALTAVLGKWVYDAYQQTPGVVRCLMGYIVDLTIVMRRLFWHMQIKGGIHPVPEILVKQAADEYHLSEDKTRVHRTIEQFVKKMGIFQTAKKDIVVGEVERLIRNHRFEPNASTSQS